MVDKYSRRRRNDSDDDDSSLEEGEASRRHHHSRSRSNNNNRKEIPRDSGRSKRVDINRRRNDEADESDGDQEKNNKIDLVIPRDSSRRRSHGGRDDEDDLEEEILEKIDRRRRVRDSSGSDDEDKPRNRKEEEREIRDIRDSSRRRQGRDESAKSDEDIEKNSKTEKGKVDGEIRDRKRHDKGSSDSDEDKRRKEEEIRDIRDRDSSRRRYGRDSTTKSDEDIEKNSKTEKGKVDGEIRDKGDLSRRRRDKVSSDSDSEREIRGGGRDRDLRDDTRRHDNKPNEGGLREEEEEDKKKECHRRRETDESYRDRDQEKKRERRQRDERYDGRHQNRERESGGGGGGRDKDFRDDKRKPNEGGLREAEDKLKETKSQSGDTTLGLGRSGGIYIPPFKLAQMMKNVEDKSSLEYQRLTWDALRKSINGLVNKVNAANIKNLVTELFEENLIRGRGLFCRSCMKSQMASPAFTDVFSALVAVVNTKFPEVGELLLRRIVLQLKRAYKRNDKHQLLAAVKFIAHLVNQQVAHEIIALELLTVLLESPTDDSVEVAVNFVTECGSLLQDLSPQGLHGIFERFRGILHEGEIDKRVQFLIEGLFAVRKAKFQGHPAVRPELDLVDQEDQLTHEISLEDEIDPETSLDIFKADPLFLENEKRYEELMKNILGDDTVKDEASSEAESDDEDEEDSEDEEEEQMKIKDETETNLVNLRRTIYLTIMSSVDFEEAGHKLLKIKLEPGQEMELCIMLLECCSQERTYLRYYGLLGQRFCMINKIHQENFETCFVQQYSMIHRLETNKLRNVAKFFAHLLGTDALPWHVLSYINLTEENTTSSSRIFIKILFQELSEHLGIRLLNERLTDPAMQDSFSSIFPKDNPKNTRFSINFFTSIGLGGITESLREHLKNMPRLIMQQQTAVPGADTSSSSSSESEEEEEVKKKKRRRR